MLIWILNKPKCWIWSFFRFFSLRVVNQFFSKNLPLNRFLWKICYSSTKKRIKLSKMCLSTVFVEKLISQLIFSKKLIFRKFIYNIYWLIDFSEKLTDWLIYRKKNWLTLTWLAGKLFLKIDWLENCSRKLIEKNRLSKTKFLKKFNNWKIFEKIDCLTNFLQKSIDFKNREIDTVRIFSRKSIDRPIYS